MDLQKQKNVFKDLSGKLHFRRPSSRVLRMAEPLVFIIGLIVFAAGLQLVSVKTPAPAAPHESIHKKTASHKAAPSKPPQTTTAVPPPAAPPTPTPAPVVRKPASTAGSSKVEPVITPSPSASVSGLTPTATAPSGGGSSGSGGQVTTGYTSLNWAGYIAGSGSFTAVSGSWHATYATGNGTTTTADSTWIGIGGVTSGDLIQVGTQNIISASGQVTTSAFYEMLPDYAQIIPSIAVSPGDSMSASITRTGSTLWAITITDNANGQSFSITVSYASSLSSAEWIEEDPSYSATRQIPFDNFQAAYFSGAMTVQNGVAVNLNSSTAQPVIMVNNSGQVIAAPSAIGGGGTSFSVTP